MKRPKFLILLVAVGILFFSCKEKNAKLEKAPPVLGEAFLEEGKEQEAAAFLNQFGTFSSTAAEGKIQVVDFFFTSCPTICPKMTRHLKEVQEHFSGNMQVEIISYSIDGLNDTPGVLANYAEAYGIDSAQWKLLTGDPELIFERSRAYKVMAVDDKSGEERNLIHDGTFVLVDAQKRIRGYYNGLDIADTQRLIKDMEYLLKTL